MPYLIRDDGVVYPFDAVTAQNPRFKMVQALPAEHVAKIQLARQRAALNENLMVATKKALAESAVKRLESTRKAQAAALAPLPLTPENMDAQQDADVFSGKFGFPVEKADKESLRLFALEKFNVKIDTNRTTAELRLQVHGLLGTGMQGAA